MIQIAKTIIYICFIILGAAFIVHTLVYLIPGDPAVMLAGEYANPDDIDKIRQELSLDESFWVRFISYVLKLFMLDMGKSVYSGLPVLNTIIERFPATLLLASTAMFIAACLGITSGIIAAINKGRFIETVVLSISSLFISTPIFVTCFILTLVFSYYLNLLPPSGRSGFNPLYIILPSFALATRSIALIVRITRNELLTVLNSDYIRTVKALGFPKRKVILVFALKNIMIPVVTIILLDFGAYLGGAVVTESIFSWPGIGRLLIVSVYKRDIPMIQGVILFGAFIFIIIGLLVDKLKFFMGNSEK